MKNVILRKMLASVLTATTIITFVPIKASASWIKDHFGNWNWIENGYKSIGWKNINGNWYYFDNSGIMRTGWINDWGYWYYADSNGAIQNGIVEIDGNTYAFDNKGVMQTGKISINGLTYEFNEKGYAIGDNIPTPTKYFDKRNNLLPYGSKPPYATSNNISDDSEDDIFKDVETIKVRYRVTFDTDGGSSIPAVTNIKSGKTIDLPKEPTKEGYKFDGWYKDDDFDREFTEDTKVQSNMKVYAKWIKEDSEDNQGSGNSSSTDKSVIINDVQVVVGEKESDIGTVKVSAKAINYSGITETTIELLNKETNEVKKTQKINIGGSGYINFVFTGIEKGTYYAKVTVGKVSSNSSQFTVLSKDEISNSDVIKDMNELRLQDISLVINDLKLPLKGSRGSNIKWTSEKPQIINENTGEVNRPDGIGTEAVKLTATISKDGSDTVTKEFIAYVKKFNLILGESVTNINNAAETGNSDNEKILAVKNQLTTTAMVNIGVSDSKYKEYSNLKLNSVDEKNQIYQIEVAKSIYNNIKENKYISGDSDENVCKKELEDEALVLSEKFDYAVSEQSNLKRQNEDKIESDEKIKEAKEKLTKVINEQYEDGALRQKLKAKIDENTKESFSRYMLALTRAIEVEGDEKNSLSSIESATQYLNSSKESLTGAYLVTVELKKNGLPWSDFKGTITFKRGTSNVSIDSEVTGGSSYKATLTNGQYSIFVNGEFTGETITISNKTENKVLNYYTVRFEMKKPDIIDGKITAKYGNTINGYVEVQSKEPILNRDNNELILAVDATSNYTNEFRYVWTKLDGTSLDNSKYNSQSARLSIADISKLSMPDSNGYYKNDLICEVNPNELIISNINGVVNDNLGNSTITAKVYEYKNEEKTVELFKDGILFAKKTGNDVTVDSSGNLKADFNGLEKGSYKIKVRIGNLERESTGSFYVNRIDQSILDALKLINEAMKNDATDNDRTSLRNLFNLSNINKCLISIGLNLEEYSKLVESSNKYTTEVAKAVYRPLEYGVNDVSIIAKAFNDEVAKQMSIKKTDDTNSAAAESLKNAKEALKKALDNAMEADRVTWKKKETDYTEESFKNYVFAVMNAIKIEQKALATVSEITVATKNLTDAENALKNGYEATINIKKDGNSYDGIGTITLKKFENGSFKDKINGNNVGLGTIKTKRIESGYYNIFVNGKDTGVKFQIGNGGTNSEVLEYYTFNFNLTSTNSINIGSSGVELTEVNNRLQGNDKNKVIKSGDIVLKGNNISIKITPSMMSGIYGVNDFVYTWTGEKDVSTSTINTATAYNIASKLDITCNVKPKIL